MSADLEAGDEFGKHPNWDDELYWVCKMFDMVWSWAESFKSA